MNPTAGNRLKPAVSLSLTPPLRASAQHVGQDWRGCRYLTEGIVWMVRQTTLSKNKQSSRRRLLLRRIRGLWADCEHQSTINASGLGFQAIKSLKHTFQ